ncbi:MULTISPECIES: 3-deoxy-manno-octulosonate cytidylyltransferase [Methylomonas]|uniref:3-deoxy-manno-octulosonate cytidylyltransferase n=2 Tax=Methylomonas TaxID=416 RepID=A0A140E6Z5_9GAMM|nr:MULTISPECIES: 3-deoxy-manno-octulosonate cytidylyltransferase [Methylomonas]AMK79169.1 3-deoxy-manno-octulosonate cytidylyltransferase [Methylomonas denitrificans]OAH98196.1 3-deoxy-manno-octulosonate cytidylyltransferase [Methylomonas methanica]TCV86313.1 3-deoxy-manno-octulosonate cytidylyltransferase (CMP-KDO synthetase) [Methylomonas methanica]
MSTGFKVVIPARYGSTRLPGKPLLDIAGKPMIVHVCERALEADAEQVVVATDDQRIFAAVGDLGLQAVMTDPNHQSGTERIAEVARIMGWADEQIVVNLQGDEPLIPPGYIRDAALALAGQDQAGIATLAAKILDVEEIFNPNAVKVVLDKNGYALYFSRAAIPWNRSTFPDQHDIASSSLPHLRHIGMYAYTVGFLQRYCSWSVSQLEGVESLEQLRILWHGEPVLVRIVDKTPEAGVDTEEDLNRVSRRLLSGWPTKS